MCYPKTMLTGKQEKFAQAIIDGHSKTQAYRMAYECENMLPITVNHEAHLLSLTPTISARIAEIRGQLDTAMVGIRIDTAEKLAHEAQINLNGARMDGAWAPANKALEIIGRVSGVLDSPGPETTIKITKVTVMLPPDTKVLGADTVIDADYEILEP